MSDGQAAAEAVGKAAAGIREKLTVIEAELIQNRARVQQDQLNFPTRLNAKLSALTSVVASADGAPTRQSYDVFHDLSTRIDQHLIQLQEVPGKDLAALNDLIRTSALPVIAARASPRSGSSTARK